MKATIKLFVATMTLTMSSAIHAAALMPMPQYFDSVTLPILDDFFTVTEPRITAFIAGSDTASIITPGGHIVTRETASGHGFEWSTQSGAHGEPLIVISSSSAAPGNYRFLVTPTSERTASFSIIEDPAIQFGLMVGVEGEPLVAGKPFSLVGVAYFDHAPARGGSLKVRIQDLSGRVVADLSPLDDGGAVDPVANDGGYSDVAMLSVPGQYKAIAEFSWKGKKGRVVYPLAVNGNSRSLSLSGGFDAEEIDSNGNGLVDAYRLTFREPHTSVRETGDYAFTVEVHDPSGTFVTATRVISDPSAPISIDVPVKKLRELGDRPWTVSKTYAWKDDAVVGIWHDLGELVVDASAFERPPVILSVAGDRGVDADDDGLFEMLQVDLEADVLFGGSYGLSGDLRNVLGKLVGSVGISRMSLAKGGNTIALDFSGVDIGTAGGDGPFRLTNVLIYPNFVSSHEIAQLIPRAGETGPYSCRDFVGCGADLAHEIKRIANGLCKKHQQGLLKQLHRIETTSKRNAEVADMQLRALYHRAVTLEKSGSCPQANGSRGDQT